MQNRFLKLLTTQLKNQDPLNPMDNAQMTSQLAQMSTVSGIEKLNTTLGKMLDIYDSGQSMQAAGLIGKHVLVPGNTLPLAGGQALGGAMLTVRPIRSRSAFWMVPATCCRPSSWAARGWKRRIQLGWQENRWYANGRRQLYVPDRSRARRQKS